MKRWIFACLVLVFSAAVASQERHHELCSGFMPDNDMYIPTTFDMRAGGISEQEFNDVLDRVEALYAPEVKAHGGTLTISRNWESGTVNASAMRSGKTWLVTMYGGLARHPAVTADGFAMVACHEMGHHLGGAPKLGGLFSAARKWASNEGAADYYATLKCARRLFENDDNEKILAEMQLDPTVVKTCEAQHGRRLDQLICIRGAMAGLSVSTMLNGSSKGRALSFTTPDQSQVRKTNNKHPAAQCRLDTYYAGAVCPVPVHEALSDRDYTAGSCADERVHTAGLRPRCWFKPKGRGPWGFAEDDQQELTQRLPAAPMHEDLFPTELF